jgi:adenosylcobinamide kinase / adenosylcobinamide-phosphate guanylyltransferase
MRGRVHPRVPPSRDSCGRRQAGLLARGGAASLPRALPQWPALAAWFREKSRGPLTVAGPRRRFTGFRSARLRLSFPSGPKLPSAKHRRKRGVIVTLITGGARSGKSRHALSLLSAAGPVAYIATAEALDEDMRRRITRHRAERPMTWDTVEAPFDLAGAIRSVSMEVPIIVDCLTLWISNLLLQAGDLALDARDPWYPEGEIESTPSAMTARSGSVVVVTNEVGLGVVPPTPLGRVYRDALGRVNQRMAEVAGRVVLLVAGIPWTLK